MIWFIEIPHQRRPSCWVALSEQDAVNAICAAAARSSEAGDIDTFDQAVDFLADDLSSLLVLKSDEEAVQALDDDDLWHRHGGPAGYDALCEKLLEYELIREPADADD